MKIVVGNQAFFNFAGSIVKGTITELLKENRVVVVEDNTNYIHEVNIDKLIKI